MARSKSDKILRILDVVKIVGVSEKTIRRNMALGLFPKQVKIGVRCVGWLRSDIDKWLSDLKKQKGES